MFPPMTQDPVVALVQRTRSLGVVSVTVTPDQPTGVVTGYLKGSGILCEEEGGTGKGFW